MHWLLLVVAGLAEVAFAFCLGKAKLAAGSESVGWYAAFAVCSALSFYLLNLSLAQIPLGTAYAVWTGIGAVGTAAVGVLAFGDALSGPRLFFLATLIGSVLGLKLVSPHQPTPAEAPAALRNPISR
ncbi:multidrug efflux SMR transporter [Hymenobacter sp. 15J16-1T3B]|uniref:DMT family transporter n=1 Tax=Hymenobacter sp. 15J16-1T3B TaxID=2886941 RepID=UPI001D1066B6|nr:multidrug efflux SMR transporter [Hymenobacter sp. 15J16-1T3B]MCC3156367.1 multidrug efflux SMR transporter [Hymenobacter sp. 15J16-1T3B]